MEKYWNGSAIKLNLIFLPSTPDATDGCGRNVKFGTKRFNITVVEERFHILQQKLIPLSGGLYIKPSSTTSPTSLF